MNSMIEKKTYTVVITEDKDDYGFIGRCDELHANSQGETFGEIMENMNEAIELAAEEKPNEFNLLVVQR